MKLQKQSYYGSNIQGFNTGNELPDY